MSGSIANEPTYSNFHILHGSREDDRIYNNFSLHWQRSNQQGEFPDCGKEIPCGGWSICRGKAGFLFLILGINFFVTFVLLVVCYSSISTLQGKMENLNKSLANFSKIQDATSTLQDKMEKQSELLTNLSTMQNAISTLQDKMEKQSELLTNLSTMQDAISTLQDKMEKQSELLTDLSTMQDAISTLQDKMEKQSELLTNLSMTQDATVFVPKCPRNGCLLHGKWYYVPSNRFNWTNEFSQLKRFLLLVINNATQQASIEKTIGNTTHWIELMPSNETVTERPLVLLESNISKQCN
ncbi:uncharacterized protein LOC121271355 [Carcharodon carcharias]|uniref:uncharacterized protein LOC121271355 n=1 Tax=Carcharodon carcharias TaxID=13397 RepID=UPI001B7E7942|nr:uncharacterized protein LOC121271355 [Carcharodon carcharias]